MAQRKPTPPYLRRYIDTDVSDLALPCSNVADITDSGGGTGAAGGTIAAGVGKYWQSFEYNMADITAADMITDWVVGHKFKIFDFEIHVIVPSTTASDAATVSLDIGTTAVTGASIALTSATTSTKGAIVTTSTALASNTGSASDTLTVKGSGVTAFAEGRIRIAIGIQNMDTADAFAVLAAQNAALLSSLETGNVMSAS